MEIDHLKCLVLDATYRVIDEMTAKDGLRVSFKPHISVIDTHPVSVRTSDSDWPVPSKILLNYVVKKKSSVYNVPAQLNNRNLFIRDRFTCLYCGRHESELNKKRGETLTRDHVLPRDKGGPDVWNNVVTACSKCNNRKANYLLEEVDMVLSKKPYVPTVYEIMSKGPMKKYGF